MTKIRFRSLDISCLVLAILCIMLIALSFPGAMGRGMVPALSDAFGLVSAFLAIQGLLVLWSKRGHGKVRNRTILAWASGSALLIAIIVFIASHLAYVTVILDWGFQIDSLLDNLSLLVLLWIIVMAIAGLWIFAVSGAIWILSRILQWFLPRFLLDIRSIKYDGDDMWFKRFEAWTLSLPNVLEPSSLRLEVQTLDARGSRGRFFQNLKWQVAFGLLLAIYISLNPTLLSTMSFAQTYALVSIPLGVIPLFILPWSTLEVLGAKVKGTRRDFYLHKGAKKRMLQTLLALGTLVLIVRSAVVQIGAAVLLVTFAGYLITLIILSAMASFIYFNFFETDLVKNIQERSEAMGLLEP